MFSMRASPSLPVVGQCARMVPFSVFTIMMKRLGRDRTSPSMCLMVNLYDWSEIDLVSLVPPVCGGSVSYRRQGEERGRRLLRQCQEPEQWAEAVGLDTRPRPFPKVAT